jgi:hypothetical protein
VECRLSATVSGSPIDSRLTLRLHAEEQLGDARMRTCVRVCVIYDPAKPHIALEFSETLDGIVSAA